MILWSGRSRRCCADTKQLLHTICSSLCGWSPEQITKALLGIQDSFEAQIEKLRSLDYTVLDVTTSRWHDDYNSFKDVVKDLEASASNMDLNLSLSTARYLSIFRREIGFCERRSVR